ncbi:hypothetical protein [Sphingomonas daechungensis]|uniref:hypothetical protein n=1 Tax=Sphingomonas daechungensis TaxID=1176646 RepID=UPI003783ADDD
MTAMRTALFAGLLVAIAGPASAQDAETGTRLAPPKARNLGSVALTPKDQAVGAKRMAECVFNRKTALSRQALLAPTADAAKAALDRLRGEVTCFGADPSNDLVGARVAQIPPDIMRGMIAEAALGRTRDEAAALQPLPLQQIYTRNWFAVTGRHVSVDEMGACVADTNPAGVLALSRTEPMSAEENTAFGALMDNFGKCLRAGVKLQASRQALRAALAEALYQRLNAPTPAPTAATAPAVEAAKN